MTNLTHLPIEIISLIAYYVFNNGRPDSFKDLYSCALVNKLLYTAANHLLWRRINITTGDFFTTLVISLQESPRQTILAQYIQDISTSQDVPMYDAFFLLFIKPLASLKKIKIFNGEGISDRAIQYLVQYCPLIEAFQVNNTTKVTEQTIATLVQHYPRLRALSFLNGEGICPRLGDSFSSLRTCAYLRKLTLDASTMDDIDSDDTATQLALDLVEIPHLTTLRLFDSPAHFMRHLFNALASKQVGTGRAAAAGGGGGGGGKVVWPDMELFFAEGCLEVDEMDAMAFIISHPRLDLLALSSNQFSDLILDAIATYLCDISLLNLNGSMNFTAAGLRRMVNHCPSLFLLNLFGANIWSFEFPEAGVGCLDEDDDDMLCRLDYPALLKIRETEHRKEVQQMIQRKQVELEQLQQQEQEKPEQHQQERIGRLQRMLRRDPQRQDQQQEQLEQQ